VRAFQSSDTDAIRAWGGTGISGRKMGTKRGEVVCALTHRRWADDYSNAGQTAPTAINVWNFSDDVDQLQIVRVDHGPGELNVGGRATRAQRLYASGPPPASTGSDSCRIESRVLPQMTTPV
jgi:hypothetical protein